MSQTRTEQSAIQYNTIQYNTINNLVNIIPYTVTTTYNYPKLTYSSLEQLVCSIVLCYYSGKIRYYGQAAESKYHSTLRDTYHKIWQWTQKMWTGEKRHGMWTGKRQATHWICPVVMLSMLSIQSIRIRMKWRSKRNEHGKSQRINPSGHWVPTTFSFVSRLFVLLFVLYCYLHCSVRVEKVQCDATQYPSVYNTIDLTLIDDSF